MSKKLKGFLFVLLAYIPLGASYPITNNVMEKVPVFLFTFMAFFIGSCIAIPISRIKEPQIKWTKINNKNYGKLLFQSVVGVFLFTVFNLYGVKYCDPVVAGVLSSISPALILVAAFFFLKEKLSVVKIGGILLSVASVILMTVDFGNTGTDSHYQLLGFVFMILAVIAQVIYAILGKQLSYDMPPFSMTTALLVPTTIILIPFAIYDLTKFNITSLAVTDWIAILYYGAIVTFVCYWTGYEAFFYLPASIVSVGAALVPVASAFVSVIGFRKTLRIVDILGIVLIVLSIIVITFSSSGNEANIECEEEITMSKMKGVV